MKNQIKKSFSLFLAVLMVLSCWVWFTPAEAEVKAAETSDTYTVTIGYTVTDDTSAGGHFRMRVYYLANNGTASTPTYLGQDYTDDQFKKSYGSGTRDVTFSFEVPGFPVFFEGQFTVNAKGTLSFDEASIEWNKIIIGNGGTVEGYDILNGKNKYSFSRGSATTTGAGEEKTFYHNSFASASAAGESTGSETAIAYDLPYIVGFNSNTNSATSGINITLNKSGGADKTGSNTFTHGSYFDQYGVNWTGSTMKWGTITKSSYISTNAGIDDAIAADAGSEYISVTSNTDNTTSYASTITAKAGLQEKVQKANGKYNLYLNHRWQAVWANGGTVSSYGSCPINITYPDYTISFVGNGSVSGLGYALEYKEGSNTTTTNATLNVSGPYGSTMGSVPTGKVTATGYTFKGLWTNKQPTSGNASYNALEANFAEPIDSTTFSQYQTNGGTVDGNYITYNGVQYYNAGTQWDPTNKTITADATYYGWWLSDDINVKIYDIDGAFLGQYAVKYGQTNSAISWPAPKSSYTSGSFTYTNFTGIWKNTDGEEVNQSSYTFTHDLMLTPTYSVDFTDTYTVNFINPNNGGNLTGSADYTYRQDISLKKPADQTTPADVIADLQYSYTFEGWTTTKPTTGKNYHVMLEDADFDVNGTQIILNNDWIVRSAATYYPVYRRHTKSYVVDFNYKDATGADATRELIVKYGDTIVPPTDYVPYSYVTKGFGYTFKEWGYPGKDGDATLAYNGTLVFTSDYVAIAAGALNDGTDVEPIEITAAYGAPVATPYTVTFKSVDDKGEAVVQTAEVKNKEYITQDIVDTLKPAKEWEHDDALYTYAQSWKITEGAAKLGDAETGTALEVDAVIDTVDLINLTPTSNITLEAVYANPKPYYVVTYVDGTQTYSERVLYDEESTESNLPTWTKKTTNDNGTPDDTTDDFDEDVVYAPSMADDAKGSYVFQGWYDEKQAAADYSATNGNRYGTQGAATTPGIEIVDKTVTLYPQFKFEPFTYEIIFLDYKGEVQLAAGEREYGQSIEAITTEANKAAQNRPQDETYTYTFIGWDKPVPTFCEGKDMTFIAQYKPVYRHYEAKWYNSESAMSGDPLTTTHHTYNSKVYSPSVTVTPPADNADGTKNVFAGWYYKDANGAEQKYTRGMLITGEMSFYAKYTATKKTFTVTTVVKGVEETYTVADGDKAVIADPQAGYNPAEYVAAENNDGNYNLVDGKYVEVEAGTGAYNFKASNHDAFAGWFTDAACTTAFDIDSTAITADTKIYAKFVESAHEFTNKALKTAPTYYEKGVNEVWCSCDPTQTKKDEEIAMLTDKVKPTGTIYLGGLGSWSTTDTEGAAATDGNEVTLYANADTDVIIAANDTGDVSELYNPSGIGKGIKLIRAFVFPADKVITAENYAAVQSVVTTVFEAEKEADGSYKKDLNNTANYTVKLGDMEVADLADDGSVQYNDDGSVKRTKLKDGATYIVYYYVADKADNFINAKVRTAKFIYDTSAPTFEVEGNSNAETIKGGTPTYCEEATIVASEADLTATVNGKAVALTKLVDDNDTPDDVSDDVTTYEYTITEAGNYLITVTDKAGNATSKKIKVAAHDYATKKADVTCTTDGYEKIVCLVCGDVKSDKTTAHIGHVMGTPAITQPTCTEIGYSVAKCQNCDYTEKAEYEVNDAGEFVLDAEGNKIPLFPALGHVYEEDANGDVVYTTVTAATCKTTGKAVANCTDCGKGTLTKELPVDATAHKPGTTKKLDATCTAAGKTYQVCKLCGVTINETPIAALGHTTAKENWVVTTEPTCGAKGVESLLCDRCDAVQNTREVAATGKHITYLDKTDSRYKEPAVGVKGYYVYKCETCTDEWYDEPEALVEYTVTFLNEDGTEIVNFKKAPNETIAKTDVAEPTKANSTDGKYKYTFAGWVDVADGKTVIALPFDATKDITLKASFKETEIIYTHQFMVPNVWTSTLEAEATTYDEFAVLMGAIGDVRKPVAVPTFKLADATADAALKKLYTFEFKGWADVTGVIVSDFTVALDGDATDDKRTADKTFYAVFEAKTIKYEVVYYSGTDFVWKTEVDGGESAVYANYKLDAEGNPVVDDNGDKILIEPTKAYDDEYHYAFASKWYIDETLQNEYNGEAITAKTRLYAGFNAIEHSYDKSEGKGTVTQKQTCVLPELTEYACSCGHKISEQTKDAAGHDEYKRNEDGSYVLDDGKKVVNEVEETVDGVTYKVVYCSVCNEKIRESKTSVTVIFEDENGKRYATLTPSINTYYVYEGETPTQAATAQYTYTFAGWYVKGDADKTIVKFTDDEGNKLVQATADEITYVAAFTFATRSYRVTYVDYNNNTLYTVAAVEYGKTVPAYAGKTETADLKGLSHTEDGHYVFDKWSVDTTVVVKGEVIVKPVFKLEAHTLTTKNTAATCDKAGGTTTSCTHKNCAYEYTVNATTPALGHSWDNGVVTKAPVYETQTPGEKLYTCTRCGTTKTEVIPGDSYTIKATVKDENGNPSVGVRVELQAKQADGTYVYNRHKETDNNGVAIFAGLPAGDYRVYVASTGTYYDATVNEDGSVNGGDITAQPENKPVDDSCSCSCHKNNFWGTIFRFIQMIIRFFAGHPTCCACPDERI